MTKMLLAAAIVALTPALAAGQSATLHSDAFENGGVGWELPQYGERAGASVVDGVLRIEAASRQGSVFANYTAETYTDTVIEVDVTLHDGTDDNWQTVSCRRDAETESYYDLGISADGFYLINVWRDNALLGHSIGPERSSDIRTGRGATNRIKVECVGDLLRLTINGAPTAQLRDGSLTSGMVALSADALGPGFSAVDFDNLVISSP